MPIIPEPTGQESAYLSPPDIHMQQRRKIRRPWRKVRLLKRRKSHESSPSPTSTFNVAEVDPWGIAQTQSSLKLPAWACTDRAEERHLAAMKIVLERDLQRIKEKAITGLDGRQVKVVEAFPDVYSDFRLLRFLRKDKIRDPVTAAVRYREFLQWREDNNVDEIRLRIDERLSLGEFNIFRPPDEWAVVSQYLPYSIKPISSSNGLFPVLLRIGDWDTQSLTKLVQERRLSLRTFLGYWTYLFEALQFHLYRESLRTKQMVFVEEICDLSGMAMSQFSPNFISHVLKPWIHLAQSNYPESTKSIVFLRPPKMFLFVWKLLIPLFSRGTLAKVSIKSYWDGMTDSAKLQKLREFASLRKTTLS